MSVNNIAANDVPVSQSSLVGDSRPISSSQQTMSESDLQWEMEGELVEEAEIAKRHFFRRPAPWWSWFLVFVTGVAVAVTVAPRLNIFTELVCRELQPEFSGKSLIPKLSEHKLSAGWFRNGSWTNPFLPSKFCEQDSTVQKTVAGLVTSMDMTTGVLSCLTVGYWMQLSDRYGRVRILLVAAFALIANLVVMILVSVTPEKLPGGYRFLFFGQIIEGVLGGRILLSSILLAYITDTSPLDLRTVNLVIATGLDVLGNSLGRFGGYLFSYPINIVIASGLDTAGDSPGTFRGYFLRQFMDLLSAYYFAIKIYIFVILVTIFLVPESITKSKLQRARRIYALKHKSSSESSSHADGDVSIKDRRRLKLHDYIRLLNVPFEALAIFLPRRPRDVQTGAVLNGPWDWNLFLVGCACFVKSIPGNDGKYLFQYLQRVLGSYPRDPTTSFPQFPHTNVVGAVSLIIILPLFIRWLRIRIRTKSQTRHPPEAYSPSNWTLDNLLKLDYIIVLASMVILVISMFSLAVIRSPNGWHGVLIFWSLSLGYEAALRSLALSLYARRMGQDSESGKLLGGLSVLSWISGNLIGPAIFEPLYNHTVAHFPQAVLLVAGVLGVATIMIILSIRIREKTEIY